jgi:hypothetical protein
VENKAIIVSVGGIGSHDCAGDAALYGGSDIREDTHNVDHSPMHTAPDVGVDMILEAALDTQASQQ